MANAMTFHQLATILNSIQNQATGKANLTATNTKDFVSIAQTTLKTGYDPVLSAISQVLSKTIFSVRPYTAKFAGLKADAIRYGNHVRKLNVIDKPFEEDDRIKLTDGQSIDMYSVNKPSVLQTNFYGEEVYQKSLTIFRDQLDSAFSGVDQFNQFISMVMSNASDMIEQAHETTARMTVANFIGGKILSDSDNVIYLLDQYESDTGVSDTTTQTIRQPENFVPFVKWLASYLETLSSFMTERSVKYHKNFTISNVAYNITRHTPVANQKVYINSRSLNDIDATVLSDVFHDGYLKIADTERVNYWQSINSPLSIKVTPAVNDTDGTVLSNPTEVSQDNVFGVIFDEEAAGYTTINEWSATTPFNARGGYSNMYWHFTDRYWNDFTENGVVLLLGHAPTEETEEEATSGT